MAEHHNHCSSHPLKLEINLRNWHFIRTVFSIYHRELQATGLQYLNNIQYLLISQPRLSVTYTTEASCTFFHDVELDESTSLLKLSYAPTYLHGMHTEALCRICVLWAVPGQRDHMQRNVSTNLKFLCRNYSTNVSLLAVCVGKIGRWNVCA